jgi:type IV pilus assembly protein PilM
MASNAVWGIDVGQCALRAIKLRHAEDGKVEIAAFDVVEYAKILSQPEADSPELIKEAIEKFISRNDWQRDRFVIGVPGQQTFARFCKLPPVEQKKIPDIVKFEASQQIPFEMDDVVWDYEVFQQEDSPDIEVGIFAMRKDLIRQHLDYFTDLKVAPFAIQTMPSALYNFCAFDRVEDIKQGAATVLIDVGAQNTDLVIVEPNSAWTRNIPLGGNRFTEELVKKFKLSFAKAESLKRSAATSKHARQIFQAMRPIFAELVAEIQRSLGFYGSTHRDIELKHVLACGNAFRLPGLQKYLENNLTITGGVTKLDSFTKVVDSEAVQTPQFREQIMAMATAYGLAIQGLGLAKISANLLPPELARAAMWKQKRPYFAAAAACAALAAFMPWTRIQLDQAALAANADVGRQAKSIIDRAQGFSTRYSQAAGANTAEKAKIEQLFELTDKRDLVARVVQFVHDSLPEIDPAIASVSGPDELKALINSNPGKYARVNRRQILIDALEVVYSGDIDNEPRRTASRTSVSTPSGGIGGGGGMAGGGMANRFGGGGMGGGGMDRGGRGDRSAPSRNTSSDGGGSGGNPGFLVVMRGRALFSTERPLAWALVFEEFYANLRKNGQTPGLGFYLPERDPANEGRANENLDTTLPIHRVFTPGATLGAMGAGLTGRPGFATEQPAEGAEAENTALFPDPVSGEDMQYDWSFDLAFKVKLGEAPAQEKAGDGGE